MALDVVVVNYRTPDLWRDFISSYERERWQGCTLTVVDVDPVGPLFTLPEVVDQQIVIDSNCGYGRACNEGAAVGTNEAILLANPDTLLRGVQECFDVLMEHEAWGVLGPRQVDEEGLITAGGVAGHPCSPVQRSWREPDRGQCTDVVSVVTVSGALYFIKRNLWQALTNCPTFQSVQPGAKGAFLETTHYYEETWCSYHARHHGYECVFYGAVTMTHHWHRASPHGGWADQQFGISQARFREACSAHSIECD